jgi:hypothetical protein
MRFQIDNDVISGILCFAVEDHSRGGSQNCGGLFPGENVIGGVTSRY